MSEFIIEDGIPLAKVSGTGRKPKQFRETVLKMRPGQSVLLPGGSNRYSGCTQYLRNQGFDLTFRKVGTDCRVWVLKNPLLEDKA